MRPLPCTARCPWRDRIAEVIRAGQELGEFEGDDGGDAAAILASLMDGFAVRVTLGDPARRTVRELALSGRPS